MKIALGVAQGLRYLHCEEKPSVIFRDLKAANILLDNEFCAKLSDIGLARVGPGGYATHVSTRPMGTHGYRAPEYQTTGKLTVKSYIFSFGIVLLELITGRMALDLSMPHRERSLVLWVWARPLMNDKKKMVDLADPTLNVCFPKKYLKCAVVIAHKCIKEDKNEWPDITRVVESLEHVSFHSQKTRSP